MARSGWAAVVVTTVLVGILGTGAATERAVDADAGVRPLVDSLTAFPAWSSEAIAGNGDLNGAIVAKILTLLVLMFMLASFAGRAESGAAAFLGGWAAMILTCALAGGLFYVVADLTAFDGALADQAGGALSPLVEAMNTGAVFALYTGWLVAAAVAVTRRTAPMPAAAEATAAGTSTGAAAPNPPPNPRTLFPPTVMPRMPVASWPPMPVQLGTVPPSPAWAPPRSATPLPAVALPRREGGAYGEAAARDRTASGLPRRPVPPRPADGPPPVHPTPPPPPADPTQVHPGVAPPSPAEDPTALA